MSASNRREGRGRVERYGDAAERPDLPRVARIAQAIAQKEPRAGGNVASSGTGRVASGPARGHRQSSSDCVMSCAQGPSCGTHASRPVCGRPAECRTGTSTDGFVKLVVGTIGSFSAFISSAISLELIHLGPVGNGHWRHDRPVYQHDVRRPGSHCLVQVRGMWRAITASGRTLEGFMRSCSVAASSPT